MLKQHFSVNNYILSKYTNASLKLLNSTVTMIDDFFTNKNNYHGNPN